LLEKVLNVKGLTPLVLFIFVFPAWSSQAETEHYLNVIVENITRIDSFEPDVWQYQRISKNEVAINIGKR
jgi:myosin-crossreactive antigen